MWDFGPPEVGPFAHDVLVAKRDGPSDLGVFLEQVNDPLGVALWPSSFPEGVAQRFAAQGRGKKRVHVPQTGLHFGLSSDALKGGLNGRVQVGHAGGQLPKMLADAGLGSFQGRQQVVPNLVATVGPFGVAGVFTPCQMVGLGVGLEFAFWDLKQRFQTPPIPREHAAQGERVGVAHGLEQPRFGLVVGVVGRQHGVGAVGLSKRLQPRLPRLVGLALKPLRALLQLFRLQVEFLKRPSKPFGKFRDERGVTLARFPAGMVVHMGDHRGNAKRTQDVQKHRRIEAPTGPHHHGLALGPSGAHQGVVHVLLEEGHRSRQDLRAATLSKHSSYSSSPRANRVSAPPTVASTRPVSARCIRLRMTTLKSQSPWAST